MPTASRAAILQSSRTLSYTLDQGTELPRRFLAGADAVATAEQKIVALQQQIDAYRELSSSLAIDE